jgi:hypothetical protein
MANIYNYLRKVIWAFFNQLKCSYVVFLFVLVNIIIDETFGKYVEARDFLSIFFMFFYFVVLGFVFYFLLNIFRKVFLTMIGHPPK